LLDLIAVTLAVILDELSFSKHYITLNESFLSHGYAVLFYGVGGFLGDYCAFTKSYFAAISLNKWLFLRIT